MSFQWRVIGQLRYFNQKSLSPVSITESYKGGDFLNDIGPASAGGIAMRPLALTAATRGTPEAKLIQRYAKWIGGVQYFAQSQSLDDGTWTDLFNGTR